jgi:putative ABC transport system permease protein
MVISVLEPRQEIGLRRASAPRVTTSYARSHGELVVIPAQAWVGGLIAAVVIGDLAGLLPAVRAARLSPTRACCVVR